MNFSERLVQYFKEGIASGEIRLAQKELGNNDRLRTIAIRLLEWLSLRHRYPRFRSLRMTKDAKWCQDITYLINEKGLFAKTLKVHENEIAFADQLTEDQRKELCAAADSGFERKVMRN